MPPASFAALRAILSTLPVADRRAEGQAAERNLFLTKPLGSLGRLEDLAIWYAGWRGTPRPQIRAPQVVVFAGNHAVAEQGVSAFPSEVTGQMVENFRAGGAAINVLSRLAGARLTAVELSLERPVADFTRGPAMTEADCCAAFARGWDAVDPDTDLLVAGEMGIGNSAAASALCLALLGGEVADWTGRGTGLDDPGLARKLAVVARGIEANPRAGDDPLQALAAFGGREMAAIAGAVLRARMLRIPVILDGVIATAAVLPLHVLRKGVLDHAVAGHVSAATGHARLLQHLGKEPLLSLGMRLGEGSGAALAVQIVKAAVACHSEMATFAEAGVSEGF